MKDSKKSFKQNLSGGMSSLMGDNEPSKTNIPDKASPIKKTDSLQRTAPVEDIGEIETRVTLAMNKATHEKLKDIAHWEGDLLKHIIDEAMQDYIRKYEAKNGEIKPTPENKKPKPKIRKPKN